MGKQVLTRSGSPVRLSVVLWLVLLCAVATSSRAQIAVLGKLADDRDALPGSRYSGQILVVNDTDQPAQAKIYQTDYHFQSDGSNHFNDPGTDARSNAQWISFNPSILIVPPGETLPVDFEVSVPDSIDGPLNGSYWSMLMIEDVAADSPESTTGDPEPGELGIRQIIRYGVQIATHVRTREVFDVSFGQFELLQSTDGKVIRTSVENTGNILIEPAVWVEIYDATGNVVGKFEGERSRTYPGTSVLQSVPVGELPPGQYDALMVVDAGADNIFGAQFSIGI